MAAPPDVFRLGGESLCLFGRREDTQYALHSVHHHAVHTDGYTAENYDAHTGKGMARAIRELTDLAEERLRANPELLPYQGDDRRWYRMGAPHQAMGGSRYMVDDLARLMRMSRYTGLSFTIESLQPQAEYLGVRAIRALYREGQRYWQEGVVKEDYSVG